MKGANMGISSGVLRKKYNESLENKILCKNIILITLSAMQGNSEYTDDDRVLLGRILKEKNYTNDYISDVLFQITDKYHPTDKQIGELLRVVRSDYTYKEGYIKDSLLKSVDRVKLQSEDGRALKQFIYDTEQVETILESISCNDIKLSKSEEYWQCSNWDGDNPVAIKVDNTPYLSVTDYTRVHEFDNKKGDIITLVKYNLGCGYREAIKFIRGVLSNDLDSMPRQRTHEDRRKESNHKIEEKVFDDIVLDYFEPYLDSSWVEEGITEEARIKYSIFYRSYIKQIIIPHRRWYDGAIIGFNKRNTNPIWLALGNHKYELMKGYKRSQNVYGYYENKEEIEKAKYCTVFEGEKSVIKRFCNGDCTGIATIGKNITTSQIKIIKTLNVDEVIFAYDLDVNIEELRWACEQFYIDGIKVSYIKDTFGLLSEKQSPADLPNKDYMFLFDNRIEYDEKEHEIYLKSIKKK